MKILLPVAILAGAFTTAWVSNMVGIPPSDAVQLALLAGGGAIVSGGVGTIGLYVLRKSSIAVQSMVVAFAALGAVSAGALLAARGMFISAHDLAALVVVLFAAITVGLVIAFLLGRRVGHASMNLSEAARSVAEGQPGRFASQAEPRELAALARELDQMREKLDRTRARERAMDASRRELVAWVSHDLRTPLAGIRAMTEALEDGVVSDPKTIRRYYRTLRQETDRLAHLVDDLFELSRINAGALTLNFTPVSLEDLVSDALAGASPLAEIKGINLQGAVAGEPVVLEASVSEFGRVLHNLLENAIRHTPSRGSVSLEAGLSHGQAVLMVSDECGGIPEGDLSRVFDLAFRGKSARTPDAHGGAGLGLAIARGIVEAHHGGIEVRNLAPGCRFTVTLPLRQPRVSLVLVTGGAGFIGSHIVDRLVEQGDRVRVLDNLHPLAHSDRPDYLNPQAEYLFEDIRDAEAVARAVEGVDAICHQAAMVGLGVDFGDVSEYVSINCAGTANLLSVLWNESFQGRVVLASSMVVYGEGRYLCAEHGVVVPGRRREEDLQNGLFEPRCPSCGSPLTPAAVPEDAPVQPRSVYAATKLHQEHLVEAFGAASGAHAISLRYHNVYGPRMPFDTPYAGVASIFRSSLEQGNPPQVFEDGAQIRDFVHVDDVARANLIALHAPARAGGVFNVCSGDPRRLYEMAAVLAESYGPNAPRPVISGRYREVDVRHVFADPTRADRELGFRAEVRFEEGMRRFTGDPLRTPTRVVRRG